MASLSVDDLGGGRFKVRWREAVIRDGKRGHQGRSKTVSTKAAATELQARVLRALETVGYYEHGALIEAADAEPAFAAWLRHKAARGCSAGTVRKYAGAMKQWFVAVRQVRRMGAAARVPVSLLSRGLFTDVTLAWRAAGLGETTIYGRIRVALDAWTWAADDPDAYPGVPLPPRDRSAVLPLPALYVAPDAPTLAEADACLRHLGRGAYVARHAAVVMRFTGLRVSQVLALQCGDIDLAAATLTIRTGKSRREKAELRTVPISRHLVAELAPWVAGRSADELLVRRRRDLRAPTNRNHIPGGTLTAAWQAATAAGEARREAWAPRNRQLARPDHAFRAAFQGHLEGRRVRDAAIDFLIGHAPQGTRRRHYTPLTIEELREAVDGLPPITWSSADNVVALHGREA